MTEPEGDEFDSYLGRHRIPPEDEHMADLTGSAAKVNTYVVRAAREGAWWMIRVPEIDGLTQAREFDEVEDTARSLIAVTLDAPPDSFEMTIESV
ncbi:MAG: hypothetical protein JWO57_449 [Pseudonocardiales bacterium]|nr:hypothetical protein [Pseudonocardiales bacterium]